MSNTNKKNLSREPYKGTRDFYPEDWAREKALFSAMRKVCESYGYVEYNASPLELAELYEAKSSEEIVNEQTYTFLDRGERKVTLRPEMTPTVARMIAAKRRELAFPLRWYSIPNLFRYEQPQRGRLREHYQLNVDLFGLKGIEAEVEIITLAYKIMKELGAEDSDFEIRVNNRADLEKEIKGCLIDEAMYTRAIRLLDKKDKIPKEEFEREWSKISNKNYENNKPSEHTALLLEKLKQNGVENAKYSPYLVRGFDYYTGTVFEVFDTNENNRRSLFGGGRYDELLNIFDEETVPAVGFGMGDVTALDFLETHKLNKETSSTTDVYIAVLSNVDSNFVNQTADKLRQNGINTSVDWSERKIGDQIKVADKQKIPYLIVIGEEEAKNNTLSFKELSTHNEEKLSVDEIIAKLRK